MRPRKQVGMRAILVLVGLNSRYASWTCGRVVPSWNWKLFMVKYWIAVLVVGEAILINDDEVV